MKIYFAFRSGYEKTSKYMKTFEAESVLDWFQSNWDAFQGEYGCEEQLLGVHIYGFPIDDEELEQGQKVPPPKNLAQLRAKIEEYIYFNEIKVQVNCIQVLTDDDEIELAWYVFDEIYANQYPEKVAAWLNDYLPQDFGDEGKLLGGKFINILPKGSDKGCIYYGSSSIYDGGNFEDLEGLHKIDNVRLPEFLNYLRNHKVHTKSNKGISTGLEELKFFQFIAKQLPNADFKEILGVIGTIPLTEFNEIDMDDIHDYTLEEVLKMGLAESELPQSSIIRVSEHCCEWNTVIRLPTNGILEDSFCNYFVLFDDLWVEKNKALAQNLAQFNRTWKL